ncbi:MAG TPA: metalloregulator ArsR/SmtB family transcription factor [Mycobacteriales bacterium]|nr:metalloregulator ArsR/SmtB family transcription factor [Mycobacteriales bacterium]
MSYESVLDALGDGTRRRLVEQLRGGPRSVTELAAAFPVSRPAISKHLRVLSECGLVTHETSGTRNLYRLDPRGLAELRRWTEQFWDDVLGSFADHVADTRPTARRRPR